MLTFTGVRWTGEAGELRDGRRARAAEEIRGVDGEEEVLEGPSESELKISSRSLTGVMLVQAYPSVNTTDS